MKYVFLSFAVLGLLAGGARAGVMLGTSNPPATPLAMTPGTTSGPIFVNVVSDNPPNDVMAAWQFSLQIVPIAGATGTLTFQDPATGTPPNPPNYVFDGNGLGIVAINAGAQLDANDFFDPGAGSGAVVPGSPGANLLRLDFLASANASGLFGIYAVQGSGNTQWTDDNFTTQFFTNVPDGTGAVLIGEVFVQPSVQPPANPVPEPSTLALMALGSVALAGWRWRCRRQHGRQGRTCPRGGKALPDRKGCLSQHQGRGFGFRQGSGLWQVMNF